MSFYFGNVCTHGVVRNSQTWRRFQATKGNWQLGETRPRFIAISESSVSLRPLLFRSPVHDELRTWNLVCGPTSIQKTPKKNWRFCDQYFVRSSDDAEISYFQNTAYPFHRKLDRAERNSRTRKNPQTERRILWDYQVHRTRSGK